MGAFIVDPKHVIALAVFATGNRYGSMRVPAHIMKFSGGKDMTGERREAVATYYADILFQENIRSVKARYPNEDIDTLPGPIPCPEHVEVTHKDFSDLNIRNLKPVDILAMCNCLEYQSCETEDWRDSMAFDLLYRIQKAAIRALPGYDDAVYSFRGEGE